MKATATGVGYFGVLRQPGEVFEVPDDTKQASWFTLEGKKTSSKGSRKGQSDDTGDNGDAKTGADDDSAGE